MDSHLCLLTITEYSVWRSFKMAVTNDSPTVNQISDPLHRRVSSPSHGSNVDSASHSRYHTFFFYEVRLHVDDDYGNDDDDYDAYHQVINVCLIEWPIRSFVSSYLCHWCSGQTLLISHACFRPSGIISVCLLLSFFYH